VGQVSTVPDIAPIPTLPDNIPDGIKTLLNSIPPSVMEKVKTVADNLGEKVQNGDKQIGDLQYDELGKELFANMEKGEMDEMVRSISGVMQSLDMNSLLQGLQQQ